MPVAGQNGRVEREAMGERAVVLLAVGRERGVWCGFGFRRNPAGKAARVAQLDRVTASEAAGCGFNSRHAHHSAGAAARRL